MATPCNHPTPNLHYEWDLDDDGREIEEYWCDLCNCYLTPASISGLYEREDFGLS